MKCRHAPTVYHGTITVLLHLSRLPPARPFSPKPSAMAGLSATRYAVPISTRAHTSTERRSNQIKLQAGLPRLNRSLLIATKFSDRTSGEKSPIRFDWQSVAIRQFF
jgi:hypothetical protein